MTKILAENPNDAARRMIEITADLADRMEAETRAVAVNDAIAFSVAEKDKEAAADLYARAAAEFRSRTPDMKGKIDPALLDRLEAVQRDLGQVARSNVSLLETLPSRQSNDG